MAAVSLFDQQFIDMMVPHHEGAVAMARIAETRAQHAELKALAADVIRSQASEIDRMKAWRLAWFGSEQTPSMDKMPMVEAAGGIAGRAMTGGDTMDMAKGL